MSTSHCQKCKRRRIRLLLNGEIQGFHLQCIRVNISDGLLFRQLPFLKIPDHYSKESVNSYPVLGEATTAT